MYIGAFDIGGTKTIVALADETGKIYEKKQFATNTVSCFRHLDDCVRIFSEFLKKRDLTTDQIRGVGVNLPGIVDRKKGILLKAVYAGWHEIPVKNYLQKKLKISKIVCENDVNACAEAELLFGLGKKYHNFAWMTVSTGVGGAVVCDGKLIRGAHGYAGEFGHLKVEYDNPANCPCGENGCLEAQGSGTAISRYIKEASDRKKFSTTEDVLSGVQCAELARNGEQTALGIYRKAGEYLGRGISYYVNILDPEAIIIGGGVAAAFDILKSEIRNAIGRYTFSPMKDVIVTTTPLGYEAALMGAIAIVIAEESEDK